MSWRSLRLRLLAGGVAALAIVLATVCVGLMVLFERHIERSIAQELDVYVNQLLSELTVSPEGILSVNDPPTDPRFSQPLSGLYWQVQDDRDQIIRSRSLWDAKLVVPIDEPASGELHRHEIEGPAGKMLLMAERRVHLTYNGSSMQVRLVTAADYDRVEAAKSEFFTDLIPALVLLGVVLVVTIAVQVSLGLRPLAAVRRGVQAVRSGTLDRLPESVPDEVRSVVDEVNALLRLQEEEIQRARGRAADLAHGLKTPLAALESDVVRLRQHGEEALAADVEGIGSIIRRRIDRELARARVRGRHRRGNAPSTDLAGLVSSMISVHGRTPAAASITFEQRVPDGVSVPFDRGDLAEVLGNLIENATRYAKSTVRIAGCVVNGRPVITVEDDGHGLTSEACEAALHGERVDERGGGTGLGLAIVQDVLGAYGWQLGLSRSEMGGLCVTVAPPSVSLPSSAAATPRPKLAPAAEQDARSAVPDVPAANTAERLQQAG